MSARPIRQLRVLLAGGRIQDVEHVAAVVARLGHEVVAVEISLPAALTVSEHQPVDVAIVIMGESGETALELISSIVREAACPVITVLDVEDPAFVHHAAKRGVFAYIANGDAHDDEFESTIDVVLHRFAEFHDLEDAFGRRALTERAKGILMERHALDEQAAFEMLRDHARTSNSKLIDVAQAILGARDLLPNQRRRDPRF